MISSRKLKLLRRIKTLDTIRVWNLPGDKEAGSPDYISKNSSMRKAKKFLAPLKCRNPMGHRLVRVRVHMISEEQSTGTIQT